MELKKYFAEQLEREVRASRKVLERCPEGQNSWKPHPKSMELGYLAALVATQPGWVALMINQDELDLDGSGKGFQTRPVETRAELLSLLDSGADDSRRALEGCTEEQLMTSWRVKFGGRVVSEGLRYAMIADGALSHMAHHRGQLTVYLRLNDVKVPAIFGPSADETH